MSQILETTYGKGPEGEVENLTESSDFDVGLRKR